MLLFKQFNRQVLIATVGFSMGVVVPLGAILIYFLLEPAGDQLRVFILSLIAGAIAVQVFPIFIFPRLLGGVKTYLIEFEANRTISDEFYLKSWNLVSRIPIYFSLIGILQWIMAALIILIPFEMHPDTTRSQAFYLENTLIFLALLNIILSFLFMEGASNFLLKSNVFSRELDESKKPFYRRLSVSIPIMISFMIVLMSDVYLMISFKINSNSLEMAYSNQLYNFNLSNEASMNVLFANVESSLIEFSENQQVKDAYAKKNYTELTKALQKVFHNQALYLENAFVADMDKDNTIIATGFPNSEGVGLKLSGNPIIKENLELAKEGKVFFGKAEVSPITKKIVIMITGPLKIDGKVVGIIGFPLRVGDALNTLLENIKIGKSGYSFLLDRDSVMIWHPNSNYILQKFKDSEFEALSKAAGDEHSFLNRWEGSMFLLRKKTSSKNGFQFYSTIDLAEIEKECYDALDGLVILSLGGSFVIALATFLVFYYRFKSILGIEAVLSSFGNGDLRSQVVVKSSDEFGKLAQGLNRTISQVSNVVANNQSISEDMAASAEQMSVSLGSLSANSQTQAASAEEISASIEQISAAVQSVDSQSDSQFQKVDYLKKQMQELSNEIQSTGNEVAKATLEFTKITDEARKGQISLDQMQNSISKIGESSEQIGSVIEIISSISEQINLLALNAAIEAARAGSYGRGFAVVADEIGKLAIKTASSINDISELIEKNDTEIAKGTSIIESTIALIQNIIQGVSSFQKVTESIQASTKIQLHRNERVVQEVESVNEISIMIRSSMEEQKQAIGEVAQAIFNINDLTQANAAGLEEMTATSSGIANLASNLREKINFWRINS
ncbi:MAG: methyl-accepting chemotaxis protein [Leptospira sp.]|nr:methyl-accepting chemotaxis protein [Leptospira sp.]